MELKGKKQIDRTVDIKVAQAVVWDVLSDPHLLADWVPVVNEVMQCSTDGEYEGATRTCSVEMAGRHGTMVERCVEFTPRSRIAFVLDEDSFGMNKMFEDYGFSMNLIELGPTTTRVTLQTHYTPRNAVYSAMNVLLMRRQSEVIVKQIANGLKTFSEQRASVGGDHT